eukprot:TRINITY_DN172_c0_g1_i1.p1 TRINITY_DN172_c0_g1~~TRINITY_DN172_c0_g1_i1.p1  ORF type:complete len:75 (+),score=18.42 TRINITY_DN172_c0_g1_i1:232-456(+)
MAETQANMNETAQPASLGLPKYNGLPKKSVAQQRLKKGHHERKFFDSADWAMSGKIAGKPVTEEQPSKVGSGNL